LGTASFGFKFRSTDRAKDGSNECASVLWYHTPLWINQAIGCDKRLTQATGTGTTVESVRHCLYSLRRLLSPHYAVIPAAADALLREPWETSCALLVIPGGADLGYCRVLNGEGNRKIAQFVRKGGAFIGFCAGGYYGCKMVEFEVGNGKMEVVGSRELQFFPGACRGAAFAGFQYASEEGARAPKIKIESEALGDNELEGFNSYYNGGGLFVDAGKYAGRGVEVLARYEEKEKLSVEGGDAAVVYCKIGNGGAILTGPHPEYDSPSPSGG